jgi:hypothetical protein
MQLLFPYLTPPDPEAVKSGEQKAKQENAATHVIGTYTNQRRYAGDWTLTSRRYYTIAHGPSGVDYGTLINELAAYYDNNAGLAEIDDNIPAEKCKEYGVPFQENSILIRLSGTPGSNAIIAIIGAEYIWIPYCVEHVQIPNVIDLRYPDAQEWLHNQFSDIDVYLSQELSIQLPPGTQNRTQPASFFEMLPILMDPSLGGNTMTDTIGAWMRRNKVSALIFPSARGRAGVVWREGSILRSPGWNLVDYRGLDSQFLEGLTLFLGSDPWKSEHEKYFDLQRSTDGCSWMMFAPKGRWTYPRRLSSDENLRGRLNASGEVFNVLFTIAWNLYGQLEEPLSPEFLLHAAKTEIGNNVLVYMGVEYVRKIHGQNDTSTIQSVLFECSSSSLKSGRASKGFAYLPYTPEKAYPSLDTEPNDYLIGLPVYSEVGSCVYLYYLKEVADQPNSLISKEEISGKN